MRVSPLSNGSLLPRPTIQLKPDVNKKDSITELEPQSNRPSRRATSLSLYCPTRLQSHLSSFAFSLCRILDA